MESAVTDLEQSINQANGKIASITWKIETFENEFPLADNQESVLKLIKSVAEVTEEYQSLRKEILEVQQIQKQLTDSLKSKVSQVQKQYFVLRDKIIGSELSTAQDESNKLK
ncbi:uncharacterized protein LOC130674479 [Microplitis mediator]|uniref:uncharacterized protein LOC130674479 n=1 Tax=Microplitis mediator TaxID=375433 RepID=UPI002554E0FF|nr:uncharacterized protein LOC130674479 [Microplitis mediator]